MPTATHIVIAVTTLHHSVARTFSTTTSFNNTLGWFAEGLACRLPLYVRRKLKGANGEVVEDYLLARLREVELEISGR